MSRALPIMNAEPDFDRELAPLETDDTTHCETCGFPLDDCTPFEQNRQRCFLHFKDEDADATEPFQILRDSRFFIESIHCTGNHSPQEQAGSAELLSRYARAGIRGRR